MLSHTLLRCTCAVPVAGSWQMQCYKHSCQCQAYDICVTLQRCSQPDSNVNYYTQLFENRKPHLVVNDCLHTRGPWGDLSCRGPSHPHKPYPHPSHLTPGVPPSPLCPLQSPVFCRHIQWRDVHSDTNWSVLLFLLGCPLSCLSGGWFNIFTVCLDGLWWLICGGGLFCVNWQVHYGLPFNRINCPGRKLHSYSEAPHTLHDCVF